MTAREALDGVRRRGVELFVEGSRLRYRAPRGALTPEVRATLSAHRAELLAMLTAPGFDPDVSDLVAFRLNATAIGDVWCVLDEATLAEQPDIVRSGLPVLFFDEVEALRGKTPAELATVGLVKATFPTSRVLQ